MDPPSNGPAAGGHKTYVFVDEYNRHKRLKVMRACDGCRKRKIRCDGALQNGPWPCGACLRLKLKCVPPTLDSDDEMPPPDDATGPGQLSFQLSSGPGSGQPNGLPQRQSSQEWPAAGVAPVVNAAAPTSTPSRHGIDSGVFSTPMYSPHLVPRLDRDFSEDEYFASNTSPAFQSGSRAQPSLPRTQTDMSNDSSGDPQDVDATVKELSHQMGDLAIDLSSAAPYIANEKKALAETPAVEEAEMVTLPPSVSTDLTVRIPPEMMPSEERVMDYFGYFFDYIHPYVPVLNRQAFYEQWRSARHSISPLVLEAIFACVARYLEEGIEVRRWLALAARHEESFKDVPRVSTIQAMIILMKAREFVQKRGYYYRSWMAVKYMTTMAVDLGFHDHYDKHRAGKCCGLSTAECLVRTRMWQLLFCLEVWVGAPQGRTDFAVEHETVDFTLPGPLSDVEAFEVQTSLKTTYLAQSVHNIKQTNVLWQTMRRYNNDWALDPLFTRQNDVFPKWLKNLPAEFQMQFTDDDTPPYIGGDHFIAYMHMYHQLILIMHHRPQLQKLLEVRDSRFKAHVDICNDAASKICLLQEALYRDFGIHGLQFMQRGIGFTIYSVLSCTMMHLATITSPDAITHTRARMFFTRHMRILELCTSSATPEMVVQINALREAFSQDTTKPFELKISLGLRSPPSETHPTPPGLQQSQHQAPVQAATSWSHLQDTGSSKTMSPASEYPPSFDNSVQPSLSYNTTGFSVPAQAAYAPSNIQPVTSTPQTGYPLEPVMSNEQTTPVWDPSGIFQQWNSAFGVQAQAPAQQVSGLQQASSAQLMPQQSSVNNQQHILSQQHPVNAAALVSGAVPAMPTVTPGMWQDAFTNAYVSGHGHKRYRDESVDFEQYAKRRG